jgi:8-amino-7-oxononanoate synthase
MSSVANLALRYQLHQIRGLERQRHAVQQRFASKIKLADAEYVNFASNDYLCLAQHPQVTAAAHDAIERYGVGATASAMVSGYSELHQAFEQRFAEFMQYDQALLFNSGFNANISMISVLADRNTIIFADKYNHASLIDGAILSRAQHQRYRHNDIAHLRDLLTRSGVKNKIILTDSVFSMQGDKAALPELSQLAEQHQALLVVDDAHGIGMLGEDGRGSVSEQGLNQQQVPIVICPLGKAFGSMGCVVVGPKAMINALTQFARGYLYSTALPPMLVAASLAGLSVLQQETWRREKLQHLICYFRQQALQSGLTLLPSDTAIQSLLVPSIEKLLLIQQCLQTNGLFVAAIRPPTIPQGTQRLRISLTCEHTEQQIDKLLALISKLL